MSVLKEIMIFHYFAIFLAAILFYANYLKLPKADSEPTKYFSNWVHWLTKSTEKKLKTPKQGYRKILLLAAGL